MSKQSKTRKELVRLKTTGPPDQFVRVEVFYDKGGSSIFGGGHIQRGYYLMVAPITITRTESGHEMHGFTLGAGRRQFLEAAGAFSPKKLEAVAAAADYREALAVVLEKNNITLAEAA